MAELGRHPWPSVFPAFHLGNNLPWFLLRRSSHDGNGTTGAGLGNEARITANSSALSAGFCKNAAAPARKAFCSLLCASRAVNTMAETPTPLLICNGWSSGRGLPPDGEPEAFAFVDSVAMLASNPPHCSTSPLVRESEDA